MKVYDFRMPLEEAMQTQRAIRRLKPDPVDDALVQRLIDLALKAPTGGNLQFWEFVVVRDGEAKARVARQNRIAWRVYGAWARWATRQDARRRRVVDAVQWQADHFEEIPVLVVACLRYPHPPFWNLAKSSYYGAIYPSVQNLLLADRAAGLGAGLITLPLWSTWAVRRILGLPWNITPCAVIPLGWPRGRYGSTTRRLAADVVSVDRYGNRAWKTSGGTTPLSATRAAATADTDAATRGRGRGGRSARASGAPPRAPRPLPRSRPRARPRAYSSIRSRPAPYCSWHSISPIRLTAGASTLLANLPSTFWGSGTQ